MQKKIKTPEPMTANELRDMQARLGWTNRQLAEALGCSMETVVKWRGAQHAIPIVAAIAIRALHDEHVGAA